MIDFRRLDGPHGVPVWLQRMPAGIESVSLRWLVFTGSADDGAVAAPGIYHWFEHLPSRGTVRYPGGYRDTELRLAEGGGESDAHTTPTYTSYEAHVPRERWKAALDILTDMIAQPLLREDDVRAERRIILEELQEWRSSAGELAEYLLPGILWDGHPLGHHPLGTRETILGMRAGQLREAFEQGYARSRAVLIVAGDLEPGELLDVAAAQIERLPQRPVSERRAPARYGPLPPWRPGSRTERTTPFESSVVYLVFPIDAGDTGALFPWLLLGDLCESGELGSPLSRLLRERRGLVYGADVDCEINPDGGYWGLTAETGGDNVEAVLDAFEDLLRDPELRSAGWHDYVRRVVEAEPRMRGLDPDGFTEEAEERLTLLGRPWSDAEWIGAQLDVSRDRLDALLDSLRRDRAHTVVFRGTGSD